MAIAAGFSKTVTDGLILGYDTADTINSFRGQPTINKFALPGTAGPGPVSDNNVTFEVNGNGTFVRLGWGQMIGDYLTQPGDVVYKYTLGANGCHYHGNDLAIPAGTSATFTMDYYVTPDATGFPENSTLLVFENALGGSTSVSTEVGVWKTATFTSGPTGGAGTLRMLVYPGGCGPRMASSGTLYMKNPRVEYRAYSTAFVNGERTATRSLLDVKNSFTLDVSNASFVSPGAITFDGTNDYIITNLPDVTLNENSWTMEAVVKFNSVNKGSDNAIFGHGTASTRNGLHLAERSTGVYFGFFADDLAGNTAMVANRYYHICWVYNRTTAQKFIYLNAVLDGSATQNTYTGTGNNFEVGRYPWGTSNVMSGDIPVAKMYNRVLTPGEIRQNYSLHRTRFNI